MSEREEFVALAGGEGVPFRELCRRFGISHTTGYKWVSRAKADPTQRLVDRSRRPKRSPSRSGPELEQKVLELRDRHPRWGGRKLARRLRNLGHDAVPAPSTITEILRRNDRLDPEASSTRPPFTRFEHEQPNDLWQMDFKGQIEITGGWCFPLTAVDDHSRFAVVLEACDGPRTEPTQTALTAAFRRYGLPRRITMDNGSPWASVMHGRQYHTRFAAWLMRLGVLVSHSRPRHPQTQGKDERFHRTLKLEVLGGHTWSSLSQCQEAFDRWRDVYNLERPHDALDLAVPASRYTPSPRPFPEKLPDIEYSDGCQIRKVQERGQLWFSGRRFWLGRAFTGLHVAIRPTLEDGRHDVYFCHQRIASIDLRVEDPRN